MPAYLLDTDILIDFLRGRQAAREAIAGIESAGEVPLVSTVSVAELVAGMKAGEERATEALLKVLDKIPVTETVARGGGKLLKAYRKSHAMELADALIVSTALAREATLVTRNVKHYPLPQLKVLRPY